MATRRSALGRGLGALIPTRSELDDREQEVAPEAEAEAGAASELELERIRTNPEQPRRRFDPDELERLAESIGRHGVLQPVVVRRVADSDLSDPLYELVVGERRWRASQLAGRATIPAVIADVAPRERLALALVENVQRQDLNPIELAHAFEALAAAGATQEQIGDQVGLDRSTVANHLRLLELPRELQGDVETGSVTIGHAKALLSVANPERRRSLRDRIVREQLSVRESEAAARSLGASTRAPRRRKRAAAALDPDTGHLIDLLRDRLKTQVRLQGTPARGRLEIDFFGPEELHRISQIILGEV
ncbi:MAG: ParB/RepB/Spo0J family partition protein [Myxococcota bacterium]|nr:ParB/RepB/Spo0J family partition protein [Myxococcota bacterium]